MDGTSDGQKLNVPWSECEKARNRLSERLSRIVRFLVLVLLKIFENVPISAARGEAGLASQIVNAAEETFILSNSPPTASSDKYSGSQRRHADRQRVGQMIAIRVVLLLRK